MRVFETTGKSQAQISNWIHEDKTMTTQRLNEFKDAEVDLLRRAKILACEWWSGARWEDLQDWQRHDAMTEAAGYPKGAL